jgi:hypothetical protein
MPFGEIDIIKRIGEAESLADAFNKLAGLEFITQTTGSSYQTLLGRKEFAILTDVGEKNSQLLHPYGQNLVYAFRILVTSQG